MPDVLSLFALLLGQYLVSMLFIKTERCMMNRFVEHLLLGRLSCQFMNWRAVCIIKYLSCKCSRRFRSWAHFGSAGCLRDWIEINPQAELSKRLDEDSARMSLRSLSWFLKRF